MRPRDDRVIAGVASGLSRRLGVGVGWVRIGFVVLALFGGMGPLLYAVGWLAMRSEDEDSAIAERWIGDLEGSMAWVGVGLIIIAGMLLLGSTNLVRVELVLAGGLFLAGILLYRGRILPGEPRTRSRPSTEVHAAEVAAASGNPKTTDPVEAAEWTADEPLVPVTVTDGAVVAPARTATESRVPVAPAPTRPPSYLGRLVVAASLIVIGGMALLDNVNAVDPAARHYVAAGVLVVGLGLLVGAFIGRARGLIALGLLFTPVLLLLATVRVPFIGEWGERDFAPTTAGELRSMYELAGGQLILDLSDLQGVGPETPVHAQLGMGEMIVRLPNELDVAVDADVGLGALDIFGEERGGFGVDDQLTVTNSDGNVDLVLELEVGMGVIRIEGE